MIRTRPSLHLSEMTLHYVQTEELPDF